ncbi:hypothetical protein PHYBOEH_009845 [Phytophthora boehmeriae]|uniref:Uncharacterized protein n=1 Tax=Phytophthora boehmeriae TaxID=109152 RepID=A0A8T1WYT3_9STRA|nr:hypothetical protein PHYBOEH_009845 [Phytophthora boehmeriae]
MPQRAAAKTPSISRSNSLAEPSRSTEETKSDQSPVSSFECQELELESRRLDFEVAQWKQQEALRLDRLQLKSEEIMGKETLTRQQQELEAMEIRARVIQALHATKKSPAEVREYLALLET